MVFLLFLLTLFLRLWMLGDAPFRADTVEFYKIALRNQDIIEFWKNPPWLNQLPLNESFTLLLIKLGLPATPFVVRLPFAVMGILTVFFVWRFTRIYFGRTAALMVLVWAALNPYQLYFSRTAYHYSGAMCWSAAMLWSFWNVLTPLRRREAPSNKAWALWFITATLTAYMHMSTWIVVAIQGRWLLLLALRTDADVCKKIRIPFFSGSAMVALLMSRWIWRAFRMVLDSTEQLGEEAASEYLRLFPAYFAGQNRGALILLAITLGLALWALFTGGTERRTEYRLLCRVAVIHWGIAFVYVAIVGGGLAKITYFSALWPFLIVPLGVGVSRIARKAASVNPRLGPSLAAAVAGGYIALTIVPAWAIVMIEGKATPYYRINEWVQETLPAGTPILTDRWFEPWNELAIHQPGGIAYTFTVPDEPIAHYKALNWRDTARRFFERHPTAAFLQLTPRRYEHQLERWTFPETHFARSDVIVNEPALTLRRWRVYPEDFSEANDRVALRIFYNTTEDLVERARWEGKPAVWWPDGHWDFFKPWQPMPGWPEPLMQALWIQAGAYQQATRTFRHLGELNQRPPTEQMVYFEVGRWADYRRATASSGFILYNVGNEPVDVICTIVAIAITGPIRMRVSGAVLEFPPQLLVERPIPLTLSSGAFRLPFATSAEELLLVLSIRVE